MNRIDALEAEADRRRADFAASLRKLKRKLTPLGLADAGLRKLDPQARAVETVGRSLRENPLPAVPFFLGLGWLALNVRKPKRRAQAKLPRSKGKSLIARKGMTHEDDQKT
jgi:hypothetical protein